MAENFAGGAWGTIRRGEIVVSGAWRTLTRGEGYFSAAWHQTVTFVGHLSVSVSPPSVSGFGATFKPSVVTSNTTTATPTGGLAPFTYAWALLSGNAVTITSPTTAGTAFRQTLYGSSASGTARCTASDSLGNTASADVAFSLTHEIT